MLFKTFKYGKALETVHENNAQNGLSLSGHVWGRPLVFWNEFYFSGTWRLLPYSGRHPRSAEALTMPTKVRRHLRKQPGLLFAHRRDVGRTPPPSDRNLLAPRIDARRNALKNKVGIGSKAGTPLTDADIERAEAATHIDSAEHNAYQNVQAWGHASGYISEAEAQVIYIALGDVGSQANGGWRAGTDLATKLVVIQVITELFKIRLGLGEH